MLRQWPARLQSWASDEARRTVADEPAYQALHRRLRRLGHRPSVGVVQATLVRQALPDIFVSERRVFRPSLSKLSRHDAGVLLGVNTRLVDLVDAHLLEAEEAGTGKNRHMRFDRSVIEGLRASMDDSISMPLFSRTTGLPTYAVENLCDHGHLERVGDPALRHLRHATSVSKASVERLRAGIFDREWPTPPGDAVALGTAARRIGGRLKPWNSILAALLDGSLAFLIGAGSAPGTPWLRRILVQPSQLAQFDDVRIAAAFGSGYVTPEDCSLTDAKDILNLHGTVSIDLQDVFADEIATRDQRGPKKTVSMAAVLSMARREISVAEICALAGRNPRQVKWALSPFGNARTPCGWLRAKIEDSRVLQEQIDWSVRSHRRNARVYGSP